MNPVTFGVSARGRPVARWIVNAMGAGARSVAALLFCRVPFYLLFALALGYAVSTLRAPAELSLRLLNYSFTFVAALTALSFSFAQCSGPHDPRRGPVMTSSRRFLHCLVLILAATMLRYGAFGRAPVVALSGTPALVTNALACYAVLTGFGFFCAALHAAAKGLWGEEG